MEDREPGLEHPMKVGAAQRYGHKSEFNEIFMD